ERIQRQIQISLSAATAGSSEGARVIAERSDLQRILSNLLNNSIEAIDVSGTIQIGLRTFKDSIQILVIDSGGGIPSEVLKHLLHKEYTHGKSKGHGLGLYSAKQKIDSWGGRISIQSKEGTGTSVTITLKLV